MNSATELMGNTLPNGTATVKIREQDHSIEPYVETESLKSQQRNGPMWTAINDLNASEADVSEDVSNKIMVVHVPPPCSMEKDCEKETLIAAVSHPIEEPFVMVDVEVANKMIESVPLGYNCKLCDIKDELAANETVRVVFYLYENLQKQEMQRCSIENSELFVKIRPCWKFVFLGDLVEDPNITLQDAFGDMLSNLRLTFLIAGKPYCGSRSAAGSDSAGNIEPGELKNDVKEELKLLMMRYSLSELAAANCPFPKACLSCLKVRCVARVAGVKAVQSTRPRRQNHPPKQGGTKFKMVRKPVARERRPERERKSPVVSEVKEVEPSVSRGAKEIVIDATGGNPAFIPDRDLDYKQRVYSFQAMGLRDDVVTALDSLGINQPTVIQMATIPKILQRHHVLCAAQTGSGKTLAYLAPVIHHLRDEEQRHGIVARLKRPRACVVVPGRELATQVLKVAKSFSHHARFRSVGLIGGRKQKLIQYDLESAVDLLVATPGTLLKYRKKDKLFFSDLAYLVIDEADTMFDHTFKTLTMEILRTISIREVKPPPPSCLPVDTQVTICGATWPKEIMVDTLKDILPNLKTCTSGLHRVLPHVQHKFVKITSQEKADHILRLLERDARAEGTRTIVFCNTASSCDWLAHVLDAKRMPFIRLHGNIPPVIRCELFQHFQDGKADVLVCTDIASRGLDTSDVSHVINFDFPTSLVDYIHRVGRTGRVTASTPRIPPRATSFVTHNRDVRMAKVIENAAMKCASLDEGITVRQKSRTS